ncbi:hypothetical protein F4859DRAFT_510658 [Xylaria cf. heliscus]|nr:hypothetical protein F4859DRAFT_510658 [Xylaria cf. heliscus]
MAITDSECSSICPPNTDYNESTTITYVGATADDVGSLINDFFDVSWAGLDIVMLQGPDNFPGLSIRDTNITTPLVFRFVYPDGSFEQRSEQRGVVPYLVGNGTFSGLWTTLKGDRVFENQTLVRISRYFCQTGHPFDYAAFDQTALSNVTSILAAAGKISGVSTDPVSAQLF